MKSYSKNFTVLILIGGLLVNYFMVPAVANAQVGNLVGGLVSSTLTGGADCGTGIFGKISDELRKIAGDIANKIKDALTDQAKKAAEKAAKDAAKKFQDQALRDAQEAAGQVSKEAFKDLLKVTGGADTVKKVEDKLGISGLFVGNIPVDVKNIDDSAVQNKLQATQDNTNKLVKKQCLYQPFVRTLAAMLIRSLTQSIVGWIQGPDQTGRNVGFISDFQTQFKHEMDIEGGQFINKLLGVNMCGNIGEFLKVRLQTPDPYSYSDFNRQFACTASGIVGNVKYTYENFQRNFEGGWPAFIQNTLEPQNNPYGAYLIAYEAKIEAESARAQAIQSGVQAGGGFLGFQVKEKGTCDPVPPFEGLVNADGSRDFLSPAAKKAARKRLADLGAEQSPNGGWMVCKYNTVTKTPGQTIGYMLNKSLGIGLDQAVVTNEIDNLISSTINALINKVIGYSSGGAGGIFSSSSKDLAQAVDQSADAIGAGNTGTEQTTDAPIIADILKGNLVIASLDDGVMLSNLFEIDRNIPALKNKTATAVAAPEVSNPEIPDFSQGVEILPPASLAEPSIQANLQFIKDKLAVKKAIVLAAMNILNELPNVAISFPALDGKTDALTSFESDLNGALTSLSAPTDLTLRGDLDSNLREVLVGGSVTVGLKDIADKAARKIMNNLIPGNFPSLATSDQASFETKQKEIVDLISQERVLSAKIDAQAISSLSGDDLKNFVIDNRADLMEILRLDYNLDEKYVSILDLALGISPTAQTTPTPTTSGASGSTGGATPPPAPNVQQLPNF